MNPVIFCTFFSLLFLTVYAQDDETESVTTSSVDINGSTILPSNSSFNEFCKLKFDVGNGNESVERFYYDAEKRSCFNFTFTGGITNLNNFGSETECLEQCYTEDIGQATPLNETDVVIIEPRSVDNSEAPVNKCSRPANQTTKCPGTEVQHYYYSEEWQTCFAYKACQKDQGYMSRHECEFDCKPMDGSVCGPQKEPIEATKMGTDCSSTTCPSGSICLQGMIPQCCDEESRKNVDLLYNDKCENGVDAAGNIDQYFLATVAKTCDDLICNDGFSCQKVGKHFAKCCSIKLKPQSHHIHRDSPLFEAFQLGWHNFN